MLHAASSFAAATHGPGATAAAAILLGLLQLPMAAKAVLQKCLRQQATSQDSVGAGSRVGHSTPYADDERWGSQ
jgi:hypothetical protein